MSLSFSEQDLSYFTANASASADFDAWDVEPGYATGNSVPFVNKDGKSSFSIDTYETIQIYSVDDILTATAPNGSKGEKIALRTAFFPGAKMGTHYIYEWTSTP